MSTFKRLVSALLAVVLLVGTLPPVSVRAEETESTLPVSVTETTVPEATTAPQETTAPAAETTVSTEAPTEPTDCTTVPTEAAETPAATEAAAETEAAVEETEAVVEETEVVIEETAALSTDLLASGTCGDDLTWTLSEDGTLTIEGSGAMKDYAYWSNIPWYDYGEEIVTVDLAEGVTSLCDSAFAYCYSLTTVTIPASVTSIGTYAFGSCYSLKTIQVAQSNNHYVSEDDVLFNADKTTLIQYPIKKADSSYTIPSTVTTIEDSAFEENDHLTSVVIPGSVTVIPSYAFRYCRNLSNVTLNEGLAEICNDAFSSTALTSVTIPSSVIDLSSIAFDSCYSLTAIEVSEGNEFYASHDGVLMDKEKTQILTFPNGKTSFSIPNTVTTLESCQFSWCQKLTSIEIPGSITSIPADAFYYCTALERVTLGEGIQSLGSGVFQYCSSLTSIEIPASVTYIANEAFSECTSLKEVHFKGNAPTYIDSSAFGASWDSNTVCAIVFYPADNDTWTEDVMQNYGGSLTWLVEGSVAPVAAGQCGSELYWTLDQEGTLTVSGSGNMKNYGSYYEIPWYSYRSDIRKVIFEEGATRVGSYAFYEYENLARVILPSTLTTIGTSAFNECPSLTEITLPEALTTIGNYAFAYCENLQTVTMGQNVSSIGSGAFHCTPWYNKLVADQGFVIVSGTLMEYKGTDSDVVIPDGITAIAGEAFGNNDTLVSVTLSEGITSIGRMAFEGCENLRSINFPATLTTIGEYAFRGCSSLTGVTLPEGIQSIGNYAFTRCTALTAITLPDNLTKLGYAAFSGCSGLKSIHIGSGLRALESSLFEDCTGLTRVVIPYTITLIESNAFNGCLNLSDLSFQSAAAAQGGVWDDPWADDDEYVYYPDPGTALEIQWQAFGNCHGLTEVFLPSHLSNLAYTAFDGCRNTTFFHVDSEKYVNDDNGIIYENDSYYGPMSVLVCVPAQLSGKFVIPESVENVYANFYGCSKLTSITFTSKVGGIRNSNAFRGCTSLTEIIAGPGNTNGYYNDASGALLCDSYGYVNLCAIPANLTSYTVPANVTWINTATLGNAPLTAIHVEDGNDDYYSIDGVLYDCDNDMVKYPSHKKDTSYFVPANTNYFCEDSLTDLQYLQELWFTGEQFYVNSSSFDEDVDPITGYYPQNLWDPNFYYEYAEYSAEFMTWKPYTLMAADNASVASIEPGIPLAIRPDQSLSGLKSIQADGTTVAASNYTVSESGNLVIFKTSYLSTLADTAHTFRLQFADSYEEFTTYDAASAAMAELEALLRQAEENGYYSVRWTKPLTLTRDLTIGDVRLCIAENGHLTVPAGITLTVSDEGCLDIYNGGCVDVEEGGFLTNNGGIDLYGGTSSINCAGTFLQNRGWFDISIANDGVATVTGISRDLISICAYSVANKETLLTALALQDAGYNHIYVSVTHSMTLDEDITIGQNVYLSVYPNYSEDTDTILTLNGNTELKGELHIGWYKEEGTCGIVQNNGTFTIYPTGALENAGVFRGNEPIVKSLTQTEFEAMLAEAALTGDSVDLRVPLTLERDLTIQSAGLYIVGNGHLTVPSGVTLTVNHYYISIYDGGKLDVKPGGTLYNNGSIHMSDADSYIHVDGTYIHGEDGYTSMATYTTELPDVTGIALAYLSLDFYSADEAILQYALTLQDTGYHHVEVTTSNMVITTDVTIGPDMTLYVTPSYNDDQIGLIISEGVTLTVEGQLSVGYYGSSEPAILTNNGTLIIKESGDLQIRGIFQGNDPIYQGPTQAELEAMLAEAAETGEYVYLKTPLTLERNLTIPENCDFGIRGSGQLIVPSGKTLTNNGWFSIQAGGKLDVEAGGKLVNNNALCNWDTYSNGYIHVNGSYDHGAYAYVVVEVDNGTPAEITGINKKYIELSTYIYDEADLISALTVEDQGYAHLGIYAQSLVLNSAVTIGANTSFVIQPAYDDSDLGLIITPTGSLTINGQMYVSAYDGRTGTVQNNGKVTVNRGGYLWIEGEFLGNAPINNGGHIEYVGNEPLPPEPVEIAEQDMTVDIHDQTAITLTVLPHPNQGITWTSSNKKIVDPAAIIANGDGTYTVPFAYQALGTVTLTAINGNDSSTKDTIALTVTYLDTAKKLTASAAVPAIGLQAGETALMQVFGSDAENALDARNLTFSSANEEIATVAEDGTITAGTKTGTVKITAAITGDPLKRSVTISIKVIAAQTKTLDILDESGEVTTGLELDLADLGGAAYSFTLTPQPGYAEGITAPVLTNKSIKWTSSDTKLATIQANSDGSATVTIKAGAYGVCTISAQTTDLAKITADFQLQIMDRSPRLGSNSATVNPLLASGAELALVASYGNEIDTVSLADDRFDTAYNAELGILTISAVESIKNGTVNTTLTVTCLDGHTYTYALKLSVKAQSPSITVKQLSKIDLLYSDYVVPVDVTAKDAVVTDVTLADTEDFIITNFDGERAFISFSDNYTMVPTGKPDTKATLLIFLEGYAQPVEKAITIGTTSTKPTLVTDPASSILNTALTQDCTTAFHIYDKKTKEVICLDDASVRVEGTCVEGWIVTDDNRLSLTVSGSGTVNITVQMSNWSQSVKLTHKITANTSLPTVKLGTSTLKLNGTFPGQSAASAVILSQNNLSISSFGDDNSFVTTAKAGTPAYAEAAKIRVFFDGENIVATFVDPEDLPKNGNYTYTAIPMVEGTALKALSVKVNVSRQEPKVKLSASSLKLNTLLTGNETVSALVILDNKTGYDLEIVGFQGMDAHADNVELAFEGDLLQATLLSADKAKYSFTLTPVVRDDTGKEVPLAATLKLTVQAQQSNISVSQSASGKLDLMAPDNGIVYTIKKINNANGMIDDVTLLDVNGEETDLFVIHFNGEANTVTLTLNPEKTYSTKETYKVKFCYSLCGTTVESSVLSIKVSQSKVKITADKVLFFQSQSVPMLVNLKVGSPIGAKISNVCVNTAKTPEALMKALGNENLTFDFSEGVTEARLQLTVENPGHLTAGKSYTLFLDVTPLGASTPTEVKVTITVSK